MVPSLNVVDMCISTEIFYHKFEEKIRATCCAAEAVIGAWLHVASRGVTWLIREIETS